MRGLRAVLIGPLVALALSSSLPAQTPAAAGPVRVPDLTGRDIDPLDLPEARAIVFIFTRTDCPIANRYAPEVQRLHREFGPQGVAFWLVYLDPGEAVAIIRTHMRDYGYGIPSLRDPGHVLVSLTGARVTPEAAVFRGGSLVYRGRLDDRYVDFNKVRSAPTRHDLRDVLTALLAGTAVRPRTTDAVGCFIADLR
jgi:hypothetical protein